MRIRGTDRARWRQVPTGVRDQTADEVAARRRLEARLLEVFARWGYAEVATPTLEFLDTLERGAGPGIDDRLLKFVDSGGEVLTLRPEMTVPLARLAATRLLPAGGSPLRLAYVATVFRAQERGSGRLREFTQAGVELIGEAGGLADAEVIALAGEALLAAGIDRPAISVGHAGFLRGILSTLPGPAAEAARDLLYRRAFADLESMIAAGPALDAFRLLPSLQGPDALERAMPLATTSESLAALESLRGVLDGVAAHGQAVRVEVNLGLIRDFEYYSGVVFEAHAPQGGMPLLGGGRYDDLLTRFGHPAPATGFAMGLEERVLDAVVSSARPRPPIMVRCAPADYRWAVQAGARLRDAGMVAVVVPTGSSVVADPCAWTVTVTQGGCTVEADGRTRQGTLGDLLDVVRSAGEAGEWTR